MNNQIISILIPARGRPGNLKGAIASCLDRAKHPDRVEALVGADQDDPALPLIQEVAARFGKRVRLVASRERYGYARLYEYFNRLAAISRGDWLANWNDDTEFATDGWDDLLCDAPKVAVQLLRRVELETADPTFPVTSRNIYEAMGHLSLNAHCDAWISDVSWWAGCQVIRDDIAFYHYCLADKTAQERVDDMPWFKGPEQTALRAVDIERVKALVEAQKK